MIKTKHKTISVALPSWQQLYGQLNKQQRQAVDFIDGVMMVLAGPGTGKTQLLAMRVANILRQTQMDPFNILCLTFTESGVAALRERLVTIIGPAAYRVRVHTFHSFCQRVISENLELFVGQRVAANTDNLPSKDLMAVTEAEQVALLEEIINELPGTSVLKPFGNPYLFLPDLAQVVKQLKQEHIALAEYRLLLKQIKKMLKEFSSLLDDFFALPPRERTASVCEELAQTLSSRRAAYPSLHFNFDFLDQLFVVWREKTALVETKQAASALRTKLKNDLKRWYADAANNLPKQLAVADFYGSYQAKLHERGQYDFEDMVLWVVDVLREKDDLLASLQEQFQYVLVDEYQDTNGAQNDLLFLLTEFVDEPNLFLVGDDKQAIYRFQGASLENMLAMHERHRATIKLLHLQENYRSGQTILDAAQSLIERNVASAEQLLAGGVGHLTAAHSPEKKQVVVQCYPSLQSEYFGVAAQIKQLVDVGVPPAEIAVLFRRNRDAVALGGVLRKMSVPTQLYAAENVLQEMAIEQFILLLVYLHKVDDALLWLVVHFTWLSFPEKLDSLDVLKVQGYARGQRMKLIDVISNESQLNAAGVSAVQIWLAFARQLADWQKMSVNYPLLDFLAMVLEQAGFIGYFAAGGSDQTAIMHVRRLFDEARRLCTVSPKTDLSQWLDHLAFLQNHNLRLSLDRTSLAAGTVQVMTVHRAKGLEFTYVFMPQVTDHTWGNIRTRSGVKLPHGLLKHEAVTIDKNEDERRLFYVGLTRAKLQLTLSNADAGSDGRVKAPSVFLAELDQQFLDRQTITIEPAAAEVQAMMELRPTPAKSENAKRDYVRELLTHYVMSVTHLNNYLRCPRLFYFRNVLRVPAIKTKHMAFGTAAHAALFDLFSAKEKSREFLLNRFNWHLEQEYLTPHEARDSKDLGLAVLGKYYDFYSRQWEQNVWLEYNFSGHGVTCGPVPITGLLDKIEIVDASRKIVQVVDYKTGQPDGKTKALGQDGEYRRQLIFYQLLCDNSKKFEYVMNSGEIDFIQPNRAGKYVKKKFVIAKEETAHLAAIIEQTWHSIHNLEFMDINRGCGECEYCRLR